MVFQKIAWTVCEPGSKRSNAASPPGVNVSVPLPG
jgi:hypothetical protein